MVPRLRFYNYINFSHLRQDVLKALELQRANQARPAVSGTNSDKDTREAKPSEEMHRPYINGFIYDSSCDKYFKIPKEVLLLRFKIPKEGA